MGYRDRNTWDGTKQDKAKWECATGTGISGMGQE
jgi:hypothetical protein